MGIISWIIFGAIAGWIASMIMGRNQAQGWIGNIIVGIVGAIIGGWIYSLIAGHGFEVHWSIGSFIIAVVGAIILLAILNAIQGRRV